MMPASSFQLAHIADTDCVLTPLFVTWFVLHAALFVKFPMYPPLAAPFLDSFYLIARMSSFSKFLWRSSSTFALVLPLVISPLISVAFIFLLFMFILLFHCTFSLLLTSSWDPCGLFIMRFIPQISHANAI